MVVKTNHLTEDGKKIRKEVFMVEQGFQSEFDNTDSIATHLVFYEEDKPIAACRYYHGEKEGLFWLGRIAVQKAYRGKHIGKQIVLAAEKEIRKEGGKRIRLSAQVRAKEFYEKCGYRAVGEIYLDEDCPHICMDKELEDFQE